MKLKFQKGVALITALFILVIVAGLITFMVRINQLQHVTTSYSILTARADYAALSGIEWAMQRILTGNVANLNCGGISPSLTAGGDALDIFEVSVQCTQMDFQEGGTPYQVYEITAVAGYPNNAGNYQRDSISRRLTASICPNCP